MWCESPDGLLIQHQESSVDKRFEASRHEVARLSCDDDSYAPTAITCIKPDYIKLVVTRLCHFFNTIAHKVIDPVELSALNIEIAKTLCLLKMVFPLSLFDMMVHFFGHIVEEIKILGLVFLHQMYSFERYMAVLKRYMWNRANPEGCMIQGYHTEEVVGSCTDYIDSTEQLST